MVSFIKDSLEIKFLILYILSRVNESVTLPELQSLTMIDDGIDYFAFVECVRDLVGTEHLSIEDDKYLITQKGIKNSQICEDSLPPSVRLKADKEILWFNQELMRRSLVHGSIKNLPNNLKLMELNFNDETDTIFSLKMLIPNDKKAYRLIKRFEENPSKIYEQLLRFLDEI